MKGVLLLVCLGYVLVTSRFLDQYFDWSDQKAMCEESLPRSVECVWSAPQPLEGESDE